MQTGQTRRKCRSHAFVSKHEALSGGRAKGCDLGGFDPPYKGFVPAAFRGQTSGQRGLWGSLVRAFNNNRQ